MGDLCTACLCSDRNLYFIGETGYYHIYTQILNEIPVYDLSQLCIRVCWECRALLRRLDAFKHQVKRSYTQLMNCFHQGNVAKKFISCTPHLQVQQIHNISLPPNEIKTELEHVKTEIDIEHCEPETFVNNITLVSDMVDNNVTLKTSQQRNVKPEKPEQQKSKKKLKKHKLPKIRKTKVKNKRRTSAQSLHDLGGDDYKSDLDNNVEDYEKNEINKPEEEDSEAKTALEVTKPDEQGSQETMGLDETMKPELNIKLNGEVKRTRQPPSKEILPEKPECAECGKKFSSRKTYRYHLNVLHKGQNRYPCPRCGKVYQWKSNLGRHIRTHKARDSGELYCETCDKRFASVATYRQHLRVSRRHVPESEFSFMCNDCGKKFVNKTRLRDHIDWDHLKKIKFRCQLCNKPFKCHTSLYVHMQNVHRNKEKKDNLCHVCGKSYQNAAKLKYHIVAMHTSETPYQCEQCNAAFGWYSSLYRHVREVHYKMKVQPKKSKKAKKNEVLPSLLPPQIILSAMHQPGPP